MKIWLFLIAIFVWACGGRGAEGAVEADCSDGEDNDLDGRVDCEDDGCAAADHCVELARKAREAEEAKAEALKEAAKAQAKKEEEEPPPEPYFELGDIMVEFGTNGRDISGYAAEEYCRNLKLAGKADWRLPTSEEALQIVKSGKYAKDPSSYVMWTSTKKGKNLALIVGITEGAVNPLPMQFDGECRARCVLSLKK